MLYPTRPILLISSSPRRQELLASTTIPFVALAPDPSAEPFPFWGEDPFSYSLRAALEKTTSISQSSDFLNASSEKYIFIGADTIVTYEERIFGKPNNHDDAFSTLRYLSGKTHTVVTGCVVIHEQNIYSFTTATKVSFWDCPEPLLYQYAMDDEVMDKAGSYAIQGRGAFLVKAIEGSWTNVVGLPLAELLQLLTDKKLLTLSLQTKE